MISNNKTTFQCMNVYTQLIQWVDCWFYNMLSHNTWTLQYMYNEGIK